LETAGIWVKEVEGHEARVCTGAMQLKPDSNKIKRLH